MNKKILIVCHVAQPSLGNLRNILPEIGIDYEILLSAQYDPFPGSVDDYDGLILMGGPMGIYNVLEEQWFIDEVEFTQKMIDAKKAVLGICLGCQLLAHMYGGRVFKGSKGLHLGFNKLEIVKDDPVFGNELCGVTVSNWQEDTYELKNGKSLATGTFYKEQAAKFDDHVYGMQFHPENNETRVRRLYQYYSSEDNDYNVSVDIEELVKDIQEIEPPVKKWFKPFLERLFLA